MKQMCLLTLFFLFITPMGLAQIHGDTPDPDNQGGTINDHSAFDFGRDGTGKTQADVDRDNQMRDSVHEGYVRRAAQEACAENEQTQAACAGNEAKAWGDIDEIVPIVAQAYSMFSLAFNKIPDAEVSEAPAGTESNTEGGQDSEDGQDYCGYLPPLIEGAAMAFQQMNQDTVQAIPETQGDQQRDELSRIVLTHENRSEEAQMQTIGWGVVAGCYVVQTTAYAIGGASSGAFWGVSLLKLAASTTLTIFYGMKTAAHKDYANQVRDIIAGLPGAGDCNPVTERACYCAQPETMRDQNYCVPPEFKRKAPGEVIAVTCVDAAGNSDPNCNCRNSNSCYDQKFRRIFSARFGSIGSGGIGDTGSQLFRGEIARGNVNSFSQGTFAAAKRLLQKHGNDIPDKLKVPTSALNKESRLRSQGLQKHGLPSPLANLLASKGISPQAKKHMARFRRNARPRRVYAARRPARRNTNTSLYRGSFAGSSGSRSPASNSGAKRKSKGPRHGKVLSFAQKAQNQAQITKDTSRPIFEIISHRYRVSAWRRFDVLNLD